MPAIAGVAKYIGDVVGAEYVAGLWKSDLFIELIWTTDPKVGSLTSLLSVLNPEFSTYITPSWSWARYLSPHGLSFFFHGAKIESLRPEAGFEVSMSRSGPSFYGRVLDGQLTLSTRVVSLESHQSMYHSPLPRSNMSVHAGQTHPSYILDCDDVDNRAVSQLELALVGSFTELSGKQRRYYGLIICPSHIPSRYYRVGIFVGSEINRDESIFNQTQMRKIVVI